MQMTELLEYGKHRVSGKMIFIDDAMNGKKCNCVCAGCGDVLIARQGESNDAHFAHASGDQCGYSGESALHQLAKQIIAENKMMHLPDGTLFTYSEAAIEKKVLDYRPDAILINGNDVLHIEIFVTHKVGFNKTNFLFEKGLKTIEIDLSDLSRCISKMELVQIIVEDISRKRYITGKSDLSLFNPTMREIVMTEAVMEEVCVKEVIPEEAIIEEVVMEEAVIEVVNMEEVPVIETKGESATPLFVRLLSIVVIILAAGWLFKNLFPRNRY